MSITARRSLVTLVLLGALLAGCGEPAVAPTPTPMVLAPTSIPVPPTPPPDPTSVVQAWLEAINSGDLDAAMMLMTPDAKQNGWSNAPIRNVLDWWIDIKCHFSAPICQQIGELLACDFTMTDDGCMAASGNTHGLPLRYTFDIRDGKIQTVGIGTNFNDDWSRYNEWSEQMAVWAQVSRPEEWAKIDDKLGKGGETVIKLCWDYADFVEMQAPTTAAAAQGLVDAVNGSDVSAALALLPGDAKFRMVNDEAVGAEQLGSMFDWLVGKETQYQVSDCQWQGLATRCTVSVTDGCTIASGAPDGLRGMMTFYPGEDGALRQVVVVLTDGRQAYETWVEAEAAWAADAHPDELAQSEGYSKAAGEMAVKLCQEYAAAAAAPVPVGLRPDAPPYAVHGPYWVGYKPLVIGEETDHPINAGLWYPALNPSGDPEEITYAMPWKIPDIPLDAEPVAHGHALLDAAIDESGVPYPLVVFSHGFGTSAPWYADLIEHYASHGFVILAPNHTEQFDFDYSEIWKSSIDRPNDIKQTLDYAEQAAAPGGDLAGLIDMEHVAVAGHSYGGYTALAAAGAQYDLAGFNVRCAALAADDPNAFLCAPLVPHEEDMAARAGLDPMPEGLWPSFGDPRVTAILPIAGDSYLFDQAGLAKIAVPMMAIGGTADTATPYEWGSKPAYDYTSSAKKALVTLEGAEHAITARCETLPFLRETPLSGFFCYDPVWDKDRGVDLINHFSTAFLLDTLKGDKQAAAALAPENVAFPGIRYETTAYTDAAAAVLDEATIAKIEAIADGAMTDYSIPGLAIGVVKDGELVYAKGFGETNVADNTPVTPQSLFGLASLSKMFTAAAIMQLVEQGLIDLDAPVTDYLPEFRLDDPRYTAITVRQLLAHTSGLPWLPATTEVRSEEWGFQDPDTQEGALARMVAGLDGVALVADPGGGQVLYSNTAFDVLGDIVAAVSGQPYETYMQDNIFKPLGMESTTFVLDEADPALLAAGYRQDPESDDMSAWEFFPYNPQHSPSAGLISNVDDMSLWAEALLNEGELDGARILEAGSLEEIWSPASTMGWGGLLQDYGLGWILAEDAGHRLVWHVGGVPGFHSNLILAPEDGVAVVTMLNLNNYLQDEPWYATEVGTAVMYELLGIAE